MVGFEKGKHSVSPNNSVVVNLDGCMLLTSVIDRFLRTRLFKIMEIRAIYQLFVFETFLFLKLIILRDEVLYLTRYNNQRSTFVSHNS